MSKLIVNQVVAQMNVLPPKLQRRVLRYVESLNKSGQQGAMGKKLLQFSGTIPADDLATMKKDIEADFCLIDSA